MTEKQEICQDCWGSGWETQFVTPCTSCKGTGKILPSPIPHQDGASAEEKDALIVLNEVYGNYRVHSDTYYPLVTILKAMHQFAQSETAKVVAEKDREIRETREELRMWRDSNDRWKKRTLSAESELSTSNAHRTRLIESVKKWGGAWRTCRAELKEVKLNVKV